MGGRPRSALSHPRRLVVVAALDSFRGGEPDARPRATTAARDTAASAELREVAERLRRQNVAGVLYLSPERCESAEPAPLRAFRLPDLDRVDGPEYHACSFSLSPDGEFVAAASAVSSLRDG
jgi:hypothetical protein